MSACASCLDEAAYFGVDPDDVEATATDDAGRPACVDHAQPGAMFAI